MSRRIFERLEPRTKLTTTIILKAAVECSEMEARIAEKVLFRIGQIKIKWNMAVAEKTNDVILGIDFLEHQKAVINLTDYSIELRGETIPSTVISIKVITKLPNSEQSYKGKVKTHNYINRQNQSTTGKL